MLLLSGVSLADESIDSSRIQQGYDISPIPRSRLSLKDNNPARVGWGSYLVNAVGDCAIAAAATRFLSISRKGNPAAILPRAILMKALLGTRSVKGQLVANFNVSHYLAGGQCFGPFMARNLTPDANGLPEGLTPRCCAPAKTFIAKRTRSRRSVRSDRLRRCFKSCPGRPITA